MENENIPKTFYFQLSIHETVEATFQQVSGINDEMATKVIIEDGSNRFKHKVPNATEYSNLILKRGHIKKTSPLITWCNDTFGQTDSNAINTKTIIVTLMGSEPIPIMAWTFINAFPLEWSVINAGSMDEYIAIEDLKFSYSYFSKEAIHRDTQDRSISGGINWKNKIA